MSWFHGKWLNFCSPLMGVCSNSLPFLSYLELIALGKTLKGNGETYTGTSDPGKHSISQALHLSYLLDRALPNYKICRNWDMTVVWTLLNWRCSPIGSIISKNDSMPGEYWETENSNPAFHLHKILHWSEPFTKYIPRDITYFKIETGHPSRDLKVRFKHP